MTTDPRSGSWRPESAEDVQQAIDAGLLRESHHLDMKREVPTGGERKNIARTLASLAVDGGGLLVGVEELKAERSWRLAPQPLAGLGEQLEQIATHAIDPPLYVSVREIPVQDGKGLLWVDIAPSQHAPHMVDGAYYGRNDTTRYQLSDAEVLRLHAARVSQSDLIERLLDEEEARDPQPDPSLRHSGRMYGVAQPLTSPREAAVPLLRGPQSALRTLLVERANEHVPADLADADPAPYRFSTYQPRAAGGAFSDYSVTGPGRTLLPRRDGETPNEEDMLDLELRQDGGLRFLAGRATALWSSNQYGSDERPRVVLDALAVAYSVRLATWAERVGEAIGYRGAWGLGVRLTGLRGRVSYRYHQSMSFRSEGRPWDAEGYSETTTATRLELLEHPEQIAARLTGRLLRGLDIEHSYADALGFPRST